MYRARAPRACRGGMHMMSAMRRRRRRSTARPDEGRRARRGADPESNRAGDVMRLSVHILAGLTLLLASQAYNPGAVDLPPALDEMAWQRELNKAINAGVFDDRARAMELVGELTRLQRRGGDMLSQNKQGEHLCQFPAGATQRDRARASMRMNFTCSGSLASAALQVKTASPLISSDAGGSSPLYVDTRSVVYDMSPESSFADAPAVKVATIGGTKWKPTLNTSRTTLESYLTMAKDDGAAIALMFEYSLLDTEGPLTLDGPEIAAMREIARKVGINIICPLNLTLPDATNRNAAVVIMQNGSLARATFTGGTHTEKNFPVLGYFPGDIDDDERPPPCYCGTEDSPIYGRACDPGSSRPCMQLGESGIVPSQVGLEVFDIPGIGRIAVNTCFDIYFPEVCEN
eukprot:SAG31_NODE_8562_length_1430_cov_1.743802_1_plen_403_part_00